MHFGGMRLRTLLTLLVLTTLIPLGLFASLLIGRLWQQQRAIVERQIGRASCRERVFVGV